MSDTTDSLRDTDDDQFKTLLLDQLSKAEEKVVRGIFTLDNAYWQGRKDAFRIMLACYLNEPNIADPIATSTFRSIAVEGRGKAE